MYDTTFFIWGIVPMTLGLTVILKAIQLYFKTKRILHLFAMIWILTSTVLSEFMLYMMFFRNAWPVYTAHLLILLNSILISFLILFNRRTASNSR